MLAGPALAAGPDKGPFGYRAEGRFGAGDGHWRAVVVERRDSVLRFEFDDAATPGLRWTIIGDFATDKAQVVAVHWTGIRPASGAAGFRAALIEAGIDPFDFFVAVPIATTHKLSGYVCGPPHPDLAGCATRQGAPVYEDSQTTGQRVFELQKLKEGPVSAARFKVD
jgi:hypothetical protein